MKKLIVLMLTVSMVLTFIGCGKKINPADFDEGPMIDAGLDSSVQENEDGNPYAQSEIGQSTAYKNLQIVFGDYIPELNSYAKYEYVRDDTHEGHPCYMYSRKISKTQDGEYKHHDYIAVYKDGSMMYIV
ncbi:MAG: hypothetical protein U0M42_03265 [Acutalibacteraceae bacterium]|nr:hypothetical protein [Acutalibacteraceae bacterium]